MNEAEFMAQVAAGRSFEGVTIHACDLRGKDLSGAKLAGAKLLGVRLDGANLTGANLARAQLVSCILAGTVLEGARLDGASLVTVDLRKARARGARLTDASVLRCTADELDLSQGAFAQLGRLDEGVINVTITEPSSLARAPNPAGKVGAIPAAVPTRAEQ